VGRKKLARTIVLVCPEKNKSLVMTLFFPYTTTSAIGSDISIKPGGGFSGKRKMQR